MEKVLSYLKSFLRTSKVIELVLEDKSREKEQKRERIHK